MKSIGNINAKGHVFARDLNTGEVLINKGNDVHLENFSEAIGLALGGYDRGFVEEMHFGSGGTVVSSTGNITYAPPNVVGPTAGLYNQTYSKVVNDRSAAFLDDAAKTNIRVNHVSGANYTDFVVTCTLGYNEPADQRAFDDATVIKEDYIFDEISIVTVDSNTNIRKPLTHAIFHPVQKSLNRAIEIIYTIRITMV